MVGADDQEGGPIEGVGTGGEHGHLRSLAAPQVVADVGALAAADPVALRELGLLRPVELVEGVEQLLRVVGDAQKPLLEDPLLDPTLTALAVTVDDLLVGEDGETRGTPVDRALAVLGETGVEKLAEDPLGPPVVPGIGRVDGVIPVEHGAEQPQLASEVGDTARHQARRVLAHPQREVLGVDAECVEADRLEDIVPAQPAVSPVDVRSAEGEDISEMQSLSRRVGEHHQVVEGPLRRVERRAMRA